LICWDFSFILFQSRNEAKSNRNVWHPLWPMKEAYGFEECWRTVNAHQGQKLGWRVKVNEIPTIQALPSHLGKYASPKSIWRINETGYFFYHQKINFLVIKEIRSEPSAQS
jgi:hypothetical protein